MRKTEADRLIARYIDLMALDYRSDEQHHKMLAIGQMVRKHLGVGMHELIGRLGVAARRSRRDS